MELCLLLLWLVLLERDTWGGRLVRVVGLVVLAGVVVVLSMSDEIWAAMRTVVGRGGRDVLLKASTTPEGMMRRRMKGRKTVVEQQVVVVLHLLWSSYRDVTPRHHIRCSSSVYCASPHPGREPSHPHP